MALRNRELHARNDDDDVVSVCIVVINVFLVRMLHISITYIVC